MIKGIADIFEKTRNRSVKKKLVVMAAHDEHVLDAISVAIERNIVDAILVGDLEKINEISDRKGFNLKGCEIINEKDNDKAASVSITDRKGHI